MTLMVISPDYASHAIPLLTIAGAWQRAGHRVVVATGPAMEPMVRAAGMEYATLIMSRGSNPGIIGTHVKTADEARSLSGFFDATRKGMVPTLRFQAEARAVDLLWRPRQVAVRTIQLVESHAPDAVLVDHLAFGASIGLRALHVAYGDVVLGHPTALPVDEEIYGVPSAWPAALAPDNVEMESLRAIARGVTQAFDVAYNETLQAVAPGHAQIDHAFHAHGDLVIYNYPAEMHGAVRTARLPRHAFIGSAARCEAPDLGTARWLARNDKRPLVVVSLGTFLSQRIDVLFRTAAALKRLDVRVAMAVGAADPSELGELPQEWLVRPSLPQVALLREAALLVTHAGNNSVTEALTFGVPMLAMPFSTDQFDGAASVERNLAGISLDPNSASRPLIAGTIGGLLATPPPGPARIGERLRLRLGPDIAYAAMAELQVAASAPLPMEPTVGRPPPAVTT